MRIAFIVNRFPSISQTFILNQITGAIERGHHVDIFAGGIDEKNKVHDDVIEYDLLKRTYYFPEFKANRLYRIFASLKYIVKFFPYHLLILINSLNFFRYGKMAPSLYLLYKSVPFLKNKSYDIIHCHFGPNGNLAVLLKNLGILKGKIITTFYGYDLTSYVKKSGKEVYKELFRKGDLILSISSDFKERLIELGCSEGKILIHHLGINSDKFKFRSSNTIKNDDTIQILSIARLVEKKGIIYGIEAVRKLLRQFPNIKYLIAGEGPLKHELSDYIEKVQLNANVKLLGSKKQAEILDLMKYANLFLAPSVTSKSGDEEGTPVAIMEALASGVPVVSTYHSGIPELVIPGKTGLLANEHDSNDLAKKIEYLFQHPQKAQYMVSEGRKHIEMNYDISKLNDKLIDIYIDIIR